MKITITGLPAEAVALIRAVVAANGGTVTEVVEQEKQPVKQPARKAAKL